MKQVGVREFRDHATQYLAGDEILAIERHGQTIGFYVPAGASRRRNSAETLERFGQIVERALTETGLSEEELSRLYDLFASVPERPARRRAG